MIDCLLGGSFIYVRWHLCYFLIFLLPPCVHSVVTLCGHDAASFLLTASHQHKNKQFNLYLTSERERELNLSIVNLWKCSLCYVCVFTFCMCIVHHLHLYPIPNWYVIPFCRQSSPIGMRFIGDNFFTLVLCWLMMQW